MEYQLTANDPSKAKEFFDRKIAFTLGPAELKYFIDEGEHPAIIDVRAVGDFSQGHIPGAVNLPEDKWESLEGLRPDATNIIYCYSVVCHLAARASSFFASKGFPVMEMDGGMESWREFHYPVEEGVSAEKSQQRRTA